MLFVFPFEASFIRRDLDLLQSFCEVTPFLFSGHNAFLRMIRLMRGADVVFSWFALPFATVATVFARVTGRISVIVSGGWDVARAPEIGYGHSLHFLNALITRAGLSLAHAVLAFSKSSQDQVRRLAPRSRVRRTYLGIDSDRFLPSEKEALVVSVANVNRENLRRKGLMAFVRAARELPETRFVLAGRHSDDAVEILRAAATRNVSFPGWLEESDLRNLLGRAQVYVQASYTEGFGVALAEAMASGCVPVVTRGGAIPEIVGDTGFYVPFDDSNALADQIRLALLSDLGRRARERIVQMFSPNDRLKALHAVIFELALGLSDPPR